MSDCGRRLYNQPRRSDFFLDAEADNRTDATRTPHGRQKLMHSRTQKAAAVEVVCAAGQREALGKGGICRDLIPVAGVPAVSS